MKIARFRRSGRPQFGLLNDSTTKIRALAGSINNINDAIARHTQGDLESLCEGDWLDLGDVRILAPVSSTPRNIICVGKNYREHAREFARSGFEAGASSDVDPFPAVFTKPSSSIIGPEDKVDLHPNVTQSVDYEGELAVVIGVGGRNIRKADALSHVWGYTIINDVTARDRQKNHKQWFLGKALDTFCPMGPWIATTDEVEAGNLGVKTWVNGELRQSANTRDMIFDIPSLIETISSGMALLRGDIIATGTPAGVGIGFNPPKFLRAGDEVRIAIDGLGTLTNTFVQSM
jgi:2-keto-4-pentenoate hydratase/2-oxohepta-3-ene-1,7-dioic acid hydratase in catechol pathway